MKNRINKKVQVLLWGKIITSSVLIAFSLFLLTSSILILRNSVRKTQLKEDILVTYETSNNITKEIIPIENEFYSKEDINATNTYVSKYLDYINFDFNYSISSKLNLDGIITSDVTAYIKSYKEDTKEEIYSKKLDESNLITTEFFGKTFVEDMTAYQVDFMTVNEEAKKYEASLDFTVNTYLEIYYSTAVEGDYMSEGAVSEQNAVVLKMPLNTDITEIKEEIPRNKNINVYREMLTEKDTNIPGVIISIILIILSVYCLVVFYHQLINATQEEDYFALIKKYFKKYEEVIVRIHSIPNAKDLKVIKVETFDDLIDLQVEFRIPILYYETKKNYISKFVIIKGIYMYEFTLNRKKTKRK